MFQILLALIFVIKVLKNSINCAPKLKLIEKQEKVYRGSGGVLPQKDFESINAAMGLF